MVAAAAGAYIYASPLLAEAVVGIMLVRLSHRSPPISTGALAVPFTSSAVYSDAGAVMQQHCGAWFYGQACLWLSAGSPVSEGALRWSMWCRV